MALKRDYCRVTGPTEPGGSPIKSVQAICNYLLRNNFEKLACLPLGEGQHAIETVNRLMEAFLTIEPNLGL